MKLIREPLLHFLFAGALLFGGYAWLNRNETGANDADRTIRITEREVTWLTERCGILNDAARQAAVRWQ